MSVIFNLIKFIEKNNNIYDAKCWKVYFCSLFFDVVDVIILLCKFDKTKSSLT